MNYYAMDLEPRTCLICGRRMTESSRLSQLLRQRYPNANPECWVKAEYRCGYCKTRLTTYPRWNVEDEWDLFTGPVEKEIAKKVRVIWDTRDNYWKASHMTLISGWCNLFSINPQRLGYFLKEEGIFEQLTEFPLYETRSSIYFREKFGADWENIMIKVIQDYNHLVEIKVKVATDVQGISNLELADVERFGVETVIEQGQPHYSIYDSLTGKTVHCDTNELKETLRELKEVDI